MINNDELINKVKLYNKFFNPETLSKAYDFALKAHKHQKRETKIFLTSEVIIIQKGKLRVDFYNDQTKYLFSVVLKKNQIIMLVHGAHGFKVLESVKMLEIKQGPYKLSKDKIKFNEVDEKKIKIKKI